MAERIDSAILALESDPRPRSCKRLRATDVHRIRVGDYRVLYTIDDDVRVVEVMAIGHRRDVYRAL